MTNADLNHKPVSVLGPIADCVQSTAAGSVWTG